MKDSQSRRHHKHSALRLSGWCCERGLLGRVSGGVLSGVLSVSVLLPLSVQPAVAQVSAPACVGADPAGLGFVINGAAVNHHAGSSVSAIGDLNGDGLPELLVGAPRANPPGRSYAAGRAYVVFGKASTTSVDLANLGTGGFVVDGAAAGDEASYPISAIRDLNGDEAGISVSAIGDLNGDGLPELVVGAERADPQGRRNAGRAYVVFGKSADTNPIDLLNVQLSALTALNAALRGAAVTLTGNNLTSVSALTLGGVAVPFARNSSTRLTAVLPANAPASGSFSLSTPLDGTFTTGPFSVPPTPTGAPTISAVTPTTGGPGTRVSVSGSNLAGGTTVRFCNGVRASGRSGSNQVLFTVPRKATSGPVTVTTTTGSYNFLFTVP